MVVTLLTVIGALTLCAVISDCVFRWPPLGFILLAGVVGASWHIPTWPRFASFLGLSFSLPDLLFAVFLAVALVTASGGGRSIGEGARYALFVFFALFSVSVFRGILSFGLAPALNEARPWLYIFGISAWTLTTLRYHNNAPRWVELWVFGTAAIVTIVGFVNAVAYGFGGATTALKGSDGAILEAGRPIASGQALMVAAAMLLALWRWHSTGQTRYSVTAGACALVVILAQHRSVWIAAMGGVVVFLLVLDTGRRVLLVGAVASSVILTILILPYFADSHAVQVLSASTEDSRTYDGRVFDWVTMIDASIRSGVHTVIFGYPSGSGWWRFREDGLRIGYIPHNWYVASYLRFGIIGLSAMLAVVALFLKNGWAARKSLPLLAFVCLLICYAWAYNLQWYLAPLVAWCFWMSAPPKTSQSCDSAEPCGLNENSDGFEPRTFGCTAPQLANPARIDDLALRRLECRS